MSMSGWLPWALLSALFAAFTALFAKLGLQHVDSDFATMARTAMVLVLLVGFVALTGRWQPPRALSMSTWGWLAASALATAASWVCYYRALKLGPASVINAVDKLSVVIVALLAVALLHERPGAREWLGIALVGAGVVLIALKR